MDYPLGEVLDIPDPDYRDIDAVSQSGVRMFAMDGPWTYYKRIVEKSCHTPVTKAMELGSAGHRFLEVGCDVDKVFWVNPTHATDQKVVDRVNAALDEEKSGAARIELGEELKNKKRAHKDYKKIVEEDSDVENLVVVDAKELDIYKGGVQALYDNETCRSILLNDESFCEASIVQMDEESEVLFKCRTDVLKPDRCIDYKFNKNRRPGLWKGEAKKNGSLFQALYYMNLFERDKFTWMLICNQPPHEAFAVTVTREELNDPKSPLAMWQDHLKRKASIQEVADHTMQKLIDCYVTDVWHDDLWYGEVDLADENW